MSQVVVDDMDPRVVHTGSWTKGGTTHEYDGTVSSTTTPGDSLSLAFTGSSIAVFGTIDDTSAGVTTTYTLDNGTPNVVVSNGGVGDTYNQLFWNSSAISDGSHTLLVTVTKVNTGDGPGEGTIWFDYFSYTVLSSTSSASTSVSATASSSAGSAKSSSINIGAIIGGGMAALFVVGLLIAWLIFRHHKSKDKYSGSFVVDSHSKQAQFGNGFVPSSSPYVQPPRVAPFVIPGSNVVIDSTRPSGQFTDISGPPFPIPYAGQTVPSSTSHHSHNASQSTLQTMMSPASSGLPGGVASSVGIAPAIPGPGPSTLAPSRSTAKRRDRLVVLTYEGDGEGDEEERNTAPVVTQHVDSGIRTGSSDLARTGPVLELPPVYTAN